MYYKRRKRKKKLYLWGGILVTVLLLIATNLMTKGRLLNPVFHLIQDVTLSISRALNLPFQNIKSDTARYEEEYESLLLKNQELEYEISVMKEMLNLRETLSEYDSISAITINRNMGYWYHFITINKGSNDGIKVGMPVVSSGGLIGRVEDVSALGSTIRLLTSSEIQSKISVKIEANGTYVYGLLTNYNSTKKRFEVEGISENVEIPVGSYVTTTGMGEYFPSGILLGTVKEVTTDHFDLAKLIEVESKANFENLGMVSVLIRKDVEA